MKDESYLKNKAIVPHGKSVGDFIIDKDGNRIKVAKATELKNQVKKGVKK